MIVNYIMTVMTHNDNKLHDFTVIMTYEVYIYQDILKFIHLCK